MIRLILSTLLMTDALHARVTKEGDIILIEDTKEDHMTRITSFSDEDNADNGEPAKDIWAWGLISQRYLPHVR